MNADTRAKIRFTLSPRLQSHLSKLKAHAVKKVGTLSAEFAVADEPIPFAERFGKPKTAIKKNEIWAEKVFSCGYINFTGEVPASCKDKHVVAVIGVGGEGCVMDDSGTPVAGISSVQAYVDFLGPVKGKKVVEVAQKSEGNEKIDLWVETGANGRNGELKRPARLTDADIAVVRDDIKDLYYDYLHLSLMLCSIDRGTAKAKSIRRALNSAMRATRNFSAEHVAKARAIMATERLNGAENPLTFIATGHAHLDLAWLWPLRETRRKAGRTFINQINNIEKYDGYVFGASQPQQFAWMEEMYPELFKRIEKAIAGGKIEPQGGMWVECDTNVPCGESLIRQHLYGKRYWKEKFGYEQKMCWLPDVFGFSGNLPQIIRKCGMDYFLTIKLSWNEHNRFPHRAFLWEGIDNSEVLVHMPPEGDYNSGGTPMALFKGEKEYHEGDRIKVASLPFGVGDGGGGPSEGHLEMVKRAATSNFTPKVKQGTQIDMFTELAKYRADMVKFKGELYLEKHQGTYTTQAKNKMYNRKCEVLLHNVEFLCAEASAKGGFEYPREKIEKIWKEILLYQFHDIIPGSSIRRVYDESCARYAVMLEELEGLQASALKHLGGAKTATAVAGARTATAVNTVGFVREEIVKSDGAWYKVSLAPYSAVSLTTPAPAPRAVPANIDLIENDYFAVKFNDLGNIISVVDKASGAEYCGDVKTGGYLNKLNVYEDLPYSRYNAWDIDIKYTKTKPEEFALVDARVYTEGGVIIRENIYKYNASSIVQKVVLSDVKPIIEFQTVVDWQETHKMLRADFRPKNFAEEVTCDIQLGNLKRKTTEKDKVEWAQFEICAHKYVDVSTEEGGIAVLNDCKYGHRVKNGLISLNLLRSPMFPARDADKGKQDFRYALYPHAGTVFQSDVIRQGYLFNNPVIVTDAEVNLPSRFSSDKANIIIETVKMAEKGTATVLRVYETIGVDTTASITVPTTFKSASLSDMLENAGAKVDLSKLKFTPYEIKTIILE